MTKVKECTLLCHCFACLNGVAWQRDSKAELRTKAERGRRRIKKKLESTKAQVTA